MNKRKAAMVILEIILATSLSFQTLWAQVTTPMVSLCANAQGVAKVEASQDADAVFVWIRFMDLASGDVVREETVNNPTFPFERSFDPSTERLQRVEVTTRNLSTTLALCPEFLEVENYASGVSDENSPDSVSAYVVYTAPRPKRIFLPLIAR